MGPLAAQKKALAGPAEVPTFQKAGIKGLVIEPWFGVFVPAGIADATAGVHRGSARRSPGKGNENVI